MIKGSPLQNMVENILKIWNKICNIVFSVQNVDTIMLYFQTFSQKNDYYGP